MRFLRTRRRQMSIEFPGRCCCGRRTFNYLISLRRWRKPGAPNNPLPMPSPPFARWSFEHARHAAAVPSTARAPDIVPRRSSPPQRVSLSLSSTGPATMTALRSAKSLLISRGSTCNAHRAHEPTSRTRGSLNTLLFPIGHLWTFVWFF